jgi:hypothetical protein
MARHRKDLGARRHVRVDLHKRGFLILALDAPWIECGLAAFRSTSPSSLLVARLVKWSRVQALQEGFIGAIGIVRPRLLGDPVLHGDQEKTIPPVD